MTRWTVFTAEDPSAVKIDSESAAAKLLRRGRQVVIARYLDRVVPIELIVPLSGSKPDLAAEPRRGFIDRELLDSLSILRLSPSPLVDDATFLRRVTLDLSGRLPTMAAVRAFLAEPGPKKRQVVIDRLLASEEFSEYWTLQLAKLLRIHPDQGEGELAGTRDKQGAERDPRDGRLARGGPGELLPHRQGSQETGRVHERGLHGQPVALRQLPQPSPRSLDAG